MSLVLGIETSSQKGSVALCRGEETILSESFKTDMAHAKELIPAMNRILEKDGSNFSSLSLVAVDIGPGSFTGLRIGLVSAKFLSFVTSVPVVGVISTDAVAEAFYDKADGNVRLGVLLNAYRGMLYSAVYAGKSKREFLELLTPEEVDERLGSDTVLCGNGLARHKELLKENRNFAEAFDHPEAIYVARLGLRRFEERGGDDAESLVPLYLRQSEAEERKGVIKDPRELSLE